VIAWRIELLRSRRTDARLASSRRHRCMKAMKRNLELRSTVAVMSVILSITVPSASAQTARGQADIGERRFTVASLKLLAPLAPPAVLRSPSGEEIISERVVRTSGGSSVNPAIVSPGRIHYAATAREFLANAFNVKSFQVDGPAWMDRERFVLDATMPTESTPEELASMLRNLLADRFKLVTHRETRELPMYSLAVAKNGLKMNESSELTTTVRTISSSGRVRITAQKATMQDLANYLNLQLDRPVRDETGLPREYDFVLTFSSEGLSGSPNPLAAIPPPSSGEGPLRSSTPELPDVRELPSLFGAVQSQLGLKLDAKKGPAEVIVVDHIDKTPTDN
jgi:uncharacterized protein (TIGR03435 family)